MMTLYQSPVVFEEIPHRYLLNGKELSGVTSMLRRQLPSQYDGIPSFVLKKAADFGSKIHNEIEAADALGFAANPLVEKYLELRKSNGFEIVQNEYLISDEESIASKIDQVLTDGDGIILGDAKTTAAEKGVNDLPHRESVTYQLNVYRVLFEKYNPELKVKRLVAFWLDKHDAENSKMYDVAFLPDDVIWAMIEADKNNKVFDRYLPIAPITENTFPTELTEAESAIIAITKKVKELEDAKAKLSAKLLQVMEACDIKKWTTPNMTVTRKLESTSKRFDSTSFKKDHPELYEKYIKETKVSASVVIKVN